MDSQHPDTCAIVIDKKNYRILEIRKSILVNQITRDAERIAKSFDELHGDDLEKISKQFAHCFGILTTGMLKATEDEDDLRIACGELLSNSLNAIAGATYLLRGGFVLQPGTVMRSCFESLAVVLHLMQFQKDLEAHRAHKFESTRAITSAKRIFPPFGKIYGFLSKEFTHIGKLHKQLTPIREYTSSDEPLGLNMHFITTGVWMCFVACELVFLDVVAQPRYWVELPIEQDNPVAYSYEPSSEEQAWMESFLGIGSAP